MAKRRSLSEPAVVCAPSPRTCQADRADIGLQGIWGGESTPVPNPVCSGTQSVHGHVGPLLRRANRGTHRGGKAAEPHYRAGSGQPCPPSFPKYGPKNRCNQVSKRKRNEKVECHDLRHALRLLFSPRGSPSLGLPPAFPDQKRPGRAPWAWPSAVASARRVLPFYPSPSAFLPPATGSFLAWGKALAGARGSIPGSLLRLPPAANPFHRGSCQSHIDFGVLEPHSMMGGHREAPSIFPLRAYKRWVSMAGPCGHTAPSDFVEIIIE